MPGAPCKPIQSSANAWRALQANSIECKSLARPASRFNRVQMPGMPCCKPVQSGASIWHRLRATVNQPPSGVPCKNLVVVDRYFWRALQTNLFCTEAPYPGVPCKRLFFQVPPGWRALQAAWRTLQTTLFSPSPLQLASPWAGVPPKSGWRTL